MTLPGADYGLVRFLFQRGLAVIYLMAFLVAANQFRPLVGEAGLFSLDEYVDRVSFAERPSLFHLVTDDRAIALAAWTGVALAIGAVLAVPYRLPEPYPVPASMLLWAAMWALYQSFETLGNHVVELAVPFLYFAPQPYATLGGAATVAFQAWLLLTGNFSWLNALTLVQAIPTFSDGVLGTVLQVSPSAVGPPPFYLQALALSVGAVVLVLSVRPVKNMLSPDQRMNASFDPLHLVNTYGAFGSITKDRYQLVVEGTEVSNPAEDDWQVYEFKGQPVRLDERPPQWAPYHLRLDWQLWFAAMVPRPGPRQRWFLAFLEALLENDEDTLALLAHNPFPDDPPERVRVIRYRYRFTTPEERETTGNWWERTRVGLYVPSVSPTELRSRTVGPGMG